MPDLRLERSSQDNDLTSSSDAKSIPASQASSFGESPSSQSAGHHEFKFKSQATACAQDHDAQNRLQFLTTVNDTADLQQITAEGTHLALAPTVPRINTTFNTDTPQTRPNGSHHEVKQGQKRTANGHIKTPSSSTVTSPESANVKGHTRQSSQVGELSAQLRARLSYAMVKVQHGWQSRNIDEVETLASKQPSPMSTTASPYRNTESPRSALSEPAANYSKYPLSTRAAVLPATSLMITPQLNAPVHHDHAYPSTTQPSYASAPTAPLVHSLAPPVDFTHSHPRRVSKPLSPHPSLLNGSRHPSNLSASSTSSANPHTPPQYAQNQHTSALHQTPSQGATAMEKDAIETLLFMSSPGNSQLPTNRGSHARSSSAQPGAAMRGVFQVNLIDNKIEHIEPRKKEVWEKASFKDEESIDRVLDQMGDADDSSDDDEDTATKSSQTSDSIGRGLVYA